MFAAATAVSGAPAPRGRYPVTEGRPLDGRARLVSNVSRLAESEPVDAGDGGVRRRGFHADGTRRSRGATSRPLSRPTSSLLGAAPLLGRTLVFDDANRHRDEWSSSASLSGARDSAAAPISLDRRSRSTAQVTPVVGVMPSAFRFPHMTPAPQIWMPLHQFQPFQQLLDVRMAPFLTVIGRLGASSSKADAQAEMETIVGRLRDAHPAALREQTVRVAGLQSTCSATRLHPSCCSSRRSACCC